MARLQLALILVLALAVPSYAQRVDGSGVRVNGGAAVLVGDGTSAAPAIGFSNEAGTGWRRAATGDVRFSFSGTDQWRETANNFFYRTDTNLGWTTNTDPSSAADAFFSHVAASGNIALNSATATPRFQMGGTTASFPALKRNAAILETKLADDSAYAQHAALVFQTTTALVALGGGAAPTFGTIGGSGPATAAQNTWLLMKDSTGANFWVPAWK